VPWIPISPSARPPTEKAEKDVSTVREVGRAEAAMSLLDELSVDGEGETWVLADDPQDEAPWWGPDDQSARDQRPPV
jgi:hypothetical protein